MCVSTFSAALATVGQLCTAQQVGCVCVYVRMCAFVCVYICLLTLVWVCDPFTDWWVQKGRLLLLWCNG